MHTASVLSYSLFINWLFELLWVWLSGKTSSSEDMADQSWNLCVCGNVEELLAVLVETVSEFTSCDRDCPS